MNDDAFTAAARVNTHILLTWCEGLRSEDNAKLIPGLLRKYGGSREQKKESRSAGLQCYTPETSGLFPHSVREKRLESDE